MAGSQSVSEIVSMPFVIAVLLATSACSFLLISTASTYVRGNFDLVAEHEGACLMEKWFTDYGTTYVVQGLLGTRKLLAVDAKALHYIVHHGDQFQRSEQTQQLFQVILGKGLLFAEGPDHRRQRKVINPAFGPVQVRKFTEIFLDKANSLRDVWTDLASKTTRKDGRLRVDAFAWMNKLTLDIIGLAGFDYDFNSLRGADEDDDELYQAFQTVISKPSPFTAFQLSVSALRNLPFGPLAELKHATAIIREKGMELMQSKKNVVLVAAAHGDSMSKASFSNDLLSLCLKSNLADDLPESMRMSEDEINGQTPTFMLAGHGTTSTSVSWTLFALACHSGVQAHLRAELIQFPYDTPTMDQLNSLTMLDRVLREVLRLYAPVSALQRDVTEDTTIPLGTPVVDKKGNRHADMSVAKGDQIIIPIRIMNRSTEIWGDDSQEFRPSRWAESIPEAALGLPSIYSNLMTFGAGAHACIGFRFSIIEAKAILFSIFRNFEVELAIEPADIVRRTSFVGKPAIANSPHEGFQLPLLIRPVKPA